LTPAFSAWNPTKCRYLNRREGVRRHSTTASM
jgi:hypothetical protein